jgi:hypothetical protein
MRDPHPRVVRALREAIPPIAPPAALEERVLGAVARDDELAATPIRHPRRLRPRVALAFAGASTLVLAVVIAAGVVRSGGVPAVFELQATMRAADGSAEALVQVRKTGIGRVVTFRSHSLAILPKGEYYELWFVGPGDRPGRPNRISAGTFHPDEDGRSLVVFAAAVDPALYPALVVTAEPGDGDPRPNGPEVLRFPE